MISGLNPYPEYKDSGVPWLGEVPEHWELRRLGASVDGCVNGVWGEDPNGVDDLPCVRVADFDRTRLRVRLDRPTLRAIPPSDRRRRLLQSGDLLLEKSGGGDLQPVGVVMLYDHSANAVCSNFVARMPVADGFDSAYLTYLHSHLYAIRLNVRSIKQTTGIQNLDSSQYLSETIAFPPLPEQAAIVRYLDYMDRRIRQYIGAKQKLIKLLEEQKQAIIHRAVTCGLDPNVRLKPSGVEWLGEVPEHWESSRLKSVLSRPTRNGLFKKKDSFGSGAPLVNVADVYREDFRVAFERLDRVQATPSEVQTFQVQRGDIFFVRSSLKLEGTGRSAIVLECQPVTVFECHLVQARPNQLLVNPRFLVTQLNSFGLRHYLISQANVVTMATIAQDVIATCPLWLPPLPEQAEILSVIDKETTDLGGATRAAHREIDLLREYRTRLISDVVTGKLDVREAAAKLPEEPESGDEPEVLADEEVADEVDDFGEEVAA